MTKVLETDGNWRHTIFLRLNGMTLLCCSKPYIHCAYVAHVTVSVCHAHSINYAG